MRMAALAPRALPASVIVVCSTGRASPTTAEPLRARRPRPWIAIGAGMHLHQPRVIGHYGRDHRLLERPSRHNHLAGFDHAIRRPGLKTVRPLGQRPPLHPATNGCFELPREIPKLGHYTVPVL